MLYKRKLIGIGFPSAVNSILLYQIPDAIRVRGVQEFLTDGLPERMSDKYIEETAKSF